MSLRVRDELKIQISVIYSLSLFKKLPASRERDQSLEDYVICCVLMGEFEGSGYAKNSISVSYSQFIRKYLPASLGRALQLPWPCFCMYLTSFWSSSGVQGPFLRPLSSQQGDLPISSYFLRRFTWLTLPPPIQPSNTPLYLYSHHDLVPQSH